MKVVQNAACSLKDNFASGQSNSDTINHSVANSLQWVTVHRMVGKRLLDSIGGPERVLLR